MNWKLWIMDVYEITALFCWCYSFQNLHNRKSSGSPAESHPRIHTIIPLLVRCPRQSADDLNTNTRQHVSCMWAMRRLRYQELNSCPQLPSLYQTLSAGLGEQTGWWVKSYIILFSVFVSLKHSTVADMFFFIHVLFTNAHPFRVVLQPNQVKTHWLKTPNLFAPAILFYVMILDQKKEIYELYELHTHLTASKFRLIRF